MFFKGFVKTKDKKCIEKFKGRSDFSTLDEIKDRDEYAGILADNAILVDIDDEEQSNVLFKMVEDNDVLCRVYQTTRGKHFLFINDGIDKCFTHTKLACGITADIKVGCKNSYEVLKYNGQERKIIYDILDGEEYQTIPKWLKPIKSSIEFTDLGEGDGRNQVLFNYILKLQNNGFTVDECRDCIRLINGYVLREKLSEDEIETILRDDSFLQPVFYDDKVFLHDQFGNFMINHHHIIRLNGQLHIYKDGIYVSDTLNREIESAMLTHIPNLNRAKRQEVLSYIELIPDTWSGSVSTEWVAFQNGIYNIKTNEFRDFTSDVIITNQIPWDYNPHAYHETTDNVLNNISCHDGEIRSLLEEMVGYTMYRRNELGKAFILTGSGSNGKSTFLNMIKRMLGKENISALDLKQLNDRFSTVMMYGKLANIGDDISDEFIADTSDFKKIVTGETISAEQKGQPKFNFDPYVKLMFSSNNIPRLGKGKDSRAVMRRLVIIPFNANFDAKDPNYKPYIGDDLKSSEAMEYLIQLGIRGLMRILTNRAFTESERVEHELREYEIENNPLLRFVNECKTDGYVIENRSVDEVYERYTFFTMAENINKISKIAFSKQMNKDFGFTSKVCKIAKKPTRIFVKG